MRIPALFCLLFACISFESCKNNQSEKDVNAAKDKVEEILSSTCYKAIYENDTVDLKVNTLKSGKISGDLVMKIYANPKKIGGIYGEYHGDTLLVSYTYIDEGNEKVTYKNPMAFLKKDSLLVLGNGKLETSMGATYFVKGEPIDYENVKYKFSTVDCVGK